MLLKLLTRWREGFVNVVGVTPSQALAYAVSGSATLYAVLLSVQSSHVALPAFLQAALYWAISACRSIQLINSGLVPTQTPGTIQGQGKTP